MGEKWRSGALTEKAEFVPAPSQPGKLFHPYFACMQISERSVLITNLFHSRRDSKILNIGEVLDQEGLPAMAQLDRGLARLFFAICFEIATWKRPDQGRC